MKLRMMTSRACVNGHKTPVEATYGYLCDTCTDNLRWTLQKAPQALQHLREVYTLRRSADLEDETRPLKKDPPAPFNLDAFQLAEDIWIALTGDYIPTGTNHSQMHAIAYKKCNEIHAGLDAAVNKKEIIYLLPIIKLTKQALYRYPLEEKPRITLLPCPKCDLKTIYTPPQAFEDDLKVKCHSCGFVIPPEKMEFYAHLAEMESSQ
jgi:predicted RNA-binding Zn-ribbon protein involved in translation (DUF1610 family)